MSLPGRDKFRCELCVKGHVKSDYEGLYVECRLMPVTVRKGLNEFCAQGEWHFLNSHDCVGRYYFGEWEGVSDVPLGSIRNVGMKMLPPESV